MCDFLKKAKKNCERLHTRSQNRQYLDIWLRFFLTLIKIFHSGDIFKLTISS